MWAPYRLDIGPFVRTGHNVLRVEVTNTLANRIDGERVPSGLIGPVQLALTAPPMEARTA
jgi:hypothetical protein